MRKLSISRGKSQPVLDQIETRSGESRVKARLKVAGFTLIELLVVVSIIGVLSGMSIIGYNRFNDRQIVVQAANQLLSDLRLTQQKALSGEKPTPCAQLQQWQLRFSGSSYFLEALCVDGSYYSEPSISLPSGSERIGGSQADFYVLTGASNGQTFTIKGTLVGATSYQKQVTVTQAGGISIN